MVISEQYAVPANNDGQSATVYSEMNGESNRETKTNPDDWTTVLDCLVRILKPPSPQPMAKQLQILAKYIQLLNRSVFFKSYYPICMDWIQPFVDSQRIATFPGLGLTKLIYGSGGGSTADSSDPISLANFSAVHPVFPSSEVHLRVWNELFDCACKVFRPDQQSSAADGGPTSGNLFLNQFTDNQQSNSLPFLEPLIVRLRLQNPFPFPLILRNLRLSIDKLKKRQLENPLQQPQSAAMPFQLLTLNLELPGTSNEPLDWLAEEGQSQRQELPEPSSQVVDLRVLPSPEVEAFEVNGLHFQLCCPPSPTAYGQPHQQDSGDGKEEEVAVVDAFVPIQVRGRRLFKTKEQRISKQYAQDNRLSFTVTGPGEPMPLLAFRPAGGDPQMIGATTQHVVVEAAADQILQIVFEVENVGQIPVHQLGICSNWPEQVSLSEPNLVMTTDRWASCPMELRQSSFAANEPFPPLEPELEGAAQLGTFRCQFVSTERPLLVGQKTAIRIAIRAWPEPQPSEQLFYFLCLYSSSSGPNGGHSSHRQFRFAVPIRCTHTLIGVSLRQLNPSIGLNMLNLAGTSSTQTGIFAKMELLRLSAIYCHGLDEPAKGQEHISSRQREKILWKSGCTLRALMKKPVVFESDQRLSLCFFATQTQQDEGPINSADTVVLRQTVQWTDLWLCQPSIPDIPLWHLALTTKGDRLTAINKLYSGQGGGEEDDEEKSPILVLRLLWKASLAKNDGTIGTIFGESLLSSDEEIPADETPSLTNTEIQQ